ncbi:MAG: hypothetical protein ACR2MA_08445 [Egibacteraceae bacterium]
MSSSPGASPVQLAGQVGERALALTGVLELDGGVLGEFSTYGNGQRVRGVLVRIGAAPRVTVRLIAALGEPLPALAEQLRDRVEDVLPGARIDVAITDVRRQAAERPSTGGPS